MPIALTIFLTTLTISAIIVPLILLVIISLAVTLYQSAKRQSYNDRDAVDPNAGSQSSRHGVTNIHAMIANLEKFWHTQIGSKNVKFTVYCDPEISPRLQLDSLTMYNAVSPLIARAHHQTQSGRIHIHITQSAAQQPGFEGTLEIIVADTGSGALENLNVGTETKFHIFDLKKVQQYVSSLNGDLVYNANPGKGAEFIIHVPFTIKDIDPRIAKNMGKPASSDTQQADEIEPKSLSDMGQSNLPEMVDINAEQITPVMATPLELTEEPLSQVLSLDDLYIEDQELDDLISELTEEPDDNHAPDNQVLVLSDALDDAVEPQISDTPVENLQDLNALIITDETASHDLIQAQLEPLSNRAVSARTGASALAALNSDVFDYIIIDIQTPPLGGIDAAKIIRMQEAHNIHIPIIALFAEPADQSLHDTSSAGIDMALVKPVPAQTLFQAINTALSHQSDYQAYAQRRRAAG